ncbi:C-type lectin domain-containing protein [Caenorhabditis elegans]|uniref:C-type lectin domain-containing protein n=1 Tax=Caenorhabditis elegans TaxID=6239 RepID=Q9N3X0_CAEEL|nr:C-type lectin domain-containing protein [Caenorhabditis elegans]CCD71965.1 C-type lectin domain-containing protein [Caenorhabditis elegans]|eukprot:NP_500439.2 C-type LECtin [Caenorhabditis elegans]
MLLLKFIFLSTLAGLASAVCPDSNDHEVQGFCFKFVAQQMTYTDARNWCHYKNPVGSSYLAYVPDQKTSNYLAFYARTAFGPAAQHFWIGLSKNGSSGSLTWDNGSPVGYTNLGSQNGNNLYFTESLANTKWNTLGDDKINYFVCSYNPATTPTTPSTTTTADKNCQPGGQQTVLFAYSNDLDPSVVTDTLKQSSLEYQPIYFAVSRFDLRQPEDIGYFTDYDNVTDYVDSHAPDSSLGFGDTKTGSNVLDVIDKFYDNTKLTPCGSIVMVLLKRYSNSNDISNIVAKVRKHHGSVNFIASNTPSGGTNSRVLFDLSSRTNGLYVIDRDSYFMQSIDMMPLIERYPIYAANPVVTGAGFKDLPLLEVPSFRKHLIMVAVQDRIPVTNVHHVTVQWENSFSEYSGKLDMHPETWNNPYTNANGKRANLDASGFAMTVEYVYNDSGDHPMQIRFYSPEATDFWLPYTD